MGTTLLAVIFVIIMNLLTVSPTSIIELSSTDFFYTISSEKALLVLFHAPWCSRCRALELELAAEDLEERGITVARMDAGEASNRRFVASEAGVFSVPVYKLYFNEGSGVVDDYWGSTDYGEGPTRDAEGLIAWVCKEAMKRGVALAAPARPPLCGSIDATADHGGFGGHRGSCQSRGKISYGLCKQKLADSRECTALTYKQGECYHHDRRSEDHWAGAVEGATYAAKVHPDLDKCRRSKR